MTIAPYDWAHQIYDELKNRILYVSKSEADYYFNIHMFELIFRSRNVNDTSCKRLIFKNSDSIFLYGTETYDIKKMPSLFHAYTADTLFEGILIDRGEIVIYLKKPISGGNCYPQNVSIKIINTEQAILQDH